MTDGEPTYVLTLEERSGYLYAHIKADFMTAASARLYLNQLLEKCGELKCKRVMLHRDIPVMMAPADAFFTAQELARRFTAIMLAIVNSYVKIEDDLKFVSMVGNNRGALIEIYRTQDEAEAWLLR